MDSSGPTLEDVERTERWKTWIESYFEEIGKVAGPTDSKGAQRRFGDWVFWYDPVDVGIVILLVSTNPSLPLIHRAIRAKWEQVPPKEAAAAVLTEWRQLKENPMYVITKSASEYRR